MDETDRPDPLLKQVPLIKNPTFQPPKPVTLNANYNQLLPNLGSTSKPPKFNLTKEDLTNWSNELLLLKSKYEDQTDVENYTKWLKSQQLKIAPGLDSIITPHKIEKKDEPKKEMNELDQVFGNIDLGPGKSDPGKSDPGKSDPGKSAP